MPSNITDSMLAALKTNEIIVQLLVQNTPTINNVVLFNGKTGISIYFFHLARRTENFDYQEIAEQLIDEVYEEMSNKQPLLNFKNGLAGIAWGIEHLVQHNFVEAETDAVLSEADDKIYRHLRFVEKLPVGISKGVIGFTSPILHRLEGKDIHVQESDTFIFKRALVRLVNRIGSLWPLRPIFRA